jgi:MYXO-CTERM domain-containing protein
MDECNAVSSRRSGRAGAGRKYRSLLAGFTFAALAAVPFAATAGLNVPKAKCGPKDRPETGLQGQTSNDERANGLAEQGFQCNLELVSQFQGEGASYGFAWYDRCAYYGTANSARQAHPGVAVIDTADRASLKATAYLDARAMLEPWESLKVHPERRLLGGTKGLGRSVDDKYYAFYDVTDCAHPALLADIEVPGSIGHAGNFSPDGLTYYGTYTLGPGVTILDIADPSKPKLLLHTTDYTVHDLAFRADGNRAYFTQIPLGPTPPPNGLVIVDTSEIQSRKANPQIRTVGTLTWEDGTNAQQAVPVTYGGKPHLLFSDERGATGSGQAAKQAACDRGLPPHGFARIIDISDETKPKVVSKLMLEVSDPANCSKILSDVDRYSYSSHYCGVDRTTDPTMAACTWRDGGLRVFDIHDPAHPSEIAYYKPPARRTAFLPGSIYWGDTSTATTNGDRTGDQTASNVRFVPERKELWFTSQDNGFQIVRFTNGVGLDSAGGGGCSTGGASYAAFGLIAVALFLRRRIRRNSAGRG